MPYRFAKSLDATRATTGRPYDGVILHNYQLSNHQLPTVGEFKPPPYFSP